VTDEYKPSVNCNRVRQEGRCDASEWVQCTHCGAIDEGPCKDNKYKPLVTYDESGKALVETYDGDINQPADYSFATVNDFIHSHDRTFEELQALCLGMAVHIENLERGEFICKKCWIRKDAEKPEGLPEF